VGQKLVSVINCVVLEHTQAILCFFVLSFNSLVPLFRKIIYVQKELFVEVKLKLTHFLIYSDFLEKQFQSRRKDFIVLGIDMTESLLPKETEELLSISYDLICRLCQF
jgi:hypothetical protein